MKPNSPRIIVIRALLWLLLTATILIQFIIIKMLFATKSYQKTFLISASVTLVLFLVIFFAFRRTGKIQVALSTSFPLAIILFWWVILWQQSTLPKNVIIKFENLKNNDIVNHEQNIIVSVYPDAEKVYFLIHPYSTKFWYVQSKPISFTEDGRVEFWSEKVFFGNDPQGDCELKYDVVVLASRDNELLDIFRGRIINYGDKIEYLPVLNQSELITVTKKCG